MHSHALPSYNLPRTYFFEDAVPSYSSCANSYMNLWTKEANYTE
jgi:hypothetical protein